jgi:hypothetical protein
MNYFWIWFSGFVLCYVLIRYSYYLDKEPWTLKDRWLTIMFSLFSWLLVSIVCVWIAVIIKRRIKINWNRPVKW